MRGENVKQLLKMIDQQRPIEVTRENMLQTPTRIFSLLKVMYQSYKKNHELEILQGRILNIPKQQQKLHITKTPVSSSTLFNFNDFQESDLLLLIQMKDYLKQQSKSLFYQEIVNGIQKHNRIKECMKCYRVLLSHQFMKANWQLYDFVQQKMVNQLISKETIEMQDIKNITKDLLGLPKITVSVLKLISHLYEHVKKLSSFKHLYMIFEKNFPKDPTLQDLQALLKICLPQTLNLMKKLLQTRQQLRPLILEAAQKEAKYKLQTMQLGMTSKTHEILNFIVQTVKLGAPIWSEIIDWQHRAAQQPKNILKTNLQGTLIAMLRDIRYFQTIVAIAERLTDIDQHSQIGLILVRQLLRLDSRQYLLHKVIRRFLAIKILKYNSSQDYSRYIFGKNTKFADVILEMFEYRSNVVSFFTHIISNPDSYELFTDFISKLSTYTPTKFKEFFLRVIKVDGEKHELTSPGSSLLKLLCQKVTVEQTASIVRDLSFILPTRGFITVVDKLLNGAKDSKSLGTLKNSIARSLNLILIRFNISDLNRYFHVQFPLLLKQHLQGQMPIIFEEVPKQKSEQLKKYFEIYKNTILI